MLCRRRMIDDVFVVHNDLQRAIQCHSHIGVVNSISSVAINSVLRFCVAAPASLSATTGARTHRPCTFRAASMLPNGWFCSSYPKHACRHSSSDTSFNHLFVHRLRCLGPLTWTTHLSRHFSAWQSHALEMPVFECTQHGGVENDPGRQTVACGQCMFRFFRSCSDLMQTRSANVQPDVLDLSSCDDG